jgi:effector-binding domain-containing protein
MHFFFKKNDIASAGKPFIVYHSYDSAKKLTRFSVCMPVKDEIRTAPGSDITFDELPTLKSVKVTLNGDYSHRADAWKRAGDYIAGAKLERDPNVRVVEVLSKNIEDNKSPSKWVTQMYFPIRSSAATSAPARTMAPVRATVPPASATPSTTPKPAAKPKPQTQNTDEFSVQ